MAGLVQRIGNLRAAVLEQTKGEDIFWLGEILLSEIDALADVVTQSDVAAADFIERRVERMQADGE